MPTPRGDLNRVTVIHDSYGWVLEQHLYDGRGQKLAAAVASRHRYDPITGVSLPRHVEVQLPPAGVSFTIEVADYLINSLEGAPLHIWSMPQPSGYPLVDLCDPGVQLTGHWPSFHGHRGSTPVRVPVPQTRYQRRGIRGFGPHR